VRGALGLALLWAVAACSATTSFDTSFFEQPQGDGDADADGDGDGDGDADADTDADADGDADSDADGDADVGVRVDILMMVDNSASMAEEQANLTGSLNELLEALTEPPDLDGDGELDYRFVTDLHLGVVSSDMGTKGFNLPGCLDPVDGDDGVLLHTGSPSMGCEPEYPTFLTYDANQPDLGIDDDFTCIATLGVAGCGFEQQLLAVRRALEQTGLGGANQGFRRSDARLAVVLLTDEDDCTVVDERIFDPQAEELGDFNLRCSSHPELLEPEDSLVADLVDFVDDPVELSVVAIVGVPADLVALSDEELQAPEIQTNADFLAILDDPRMAFTVDGDGLRLVPSCDAAGLGVAFPPRRIVEVVRAMHARGVGGVVQSICQADYAGAMQSLARLVGRR